MENVTAQKALSQAIVEIAQLHGQIIGAAKITIENAIRIGELLTQIKAACGHGKFLHWLKENVSFAESTAQRYMRVYTRRDEFKSVTVTDLTEAYHLLATPKSEEPPLSEAEAALLAELEAVIEANKAGNERLLADIEAIRPDWQRFKSKFAPDTVRFLEAILDSEK